MTTAKQIMSAPIFNVTPETSVLDFAKSLMEHNKTGAPVVDEDGKLKGVVTESDLIYQHKNLHLPTVITLFESVIPLGGTHEMESQIKKMLGSTVSEIMTSDVITVDENAPLEDIATIMVEKGKHFLPVMRGDELVGVINRSDLVRSIIKGD